MAMLIDSFGRQHDYLRISLTDSCNLRCTYCMPHENYAFMPHSKMMSADEIFALAKIFCDLGVRKIRLTGGEPLVRKDFARVIENLSQLPTQLLLSTNGILIDSFLPLLKEHRITNINVSLDTLQREKFKLITKRDQFDRVWKNLLMLLECGFKVKLNIVAIRGCIEEELFTFIELTRQLPLHIRFIEFMPFTGNDWERSKVISAEELIAMASQSYDIVKLKDEPHGTARKYKVIGHEGTLAFITTMSQQFCGSCNRLRLTAEGKIKNCLFGKDELDLLTAFRTGQNIQALILQSVRHKHFSMGGQFLSDPLDTNPINVKNRSMIGIGG